MSDISEGVWLSNDVDIPYQIQFVNCEINEYPFNMWYQTDDELPYRTSFAPIFKINDYPNSLWLIQENGRKYYNIPYKNCFPELYKPVKERITKYKEYSVVLFDYDQTITLRKDVIL